VPLYYKRQESSWTAQILEPCIIRGRLDAIHLIAGGRVAEEKGGPARNARAISFVFFVIFVVIIKKANHEGHEGHEDAEEEGGVR